MILSVLLVFERLRENLKTVKKKRHNATTALLNSEKTFGPLGQTSVVSAVHM